MFTYLLPNKIFLEVDVREAVGVGVEKILSYWEASSLLRLKQRSMQK